MIRPPPQLPRDPHAPLPEGSPLDERTPFERAIERAPAWMASVLLHLAIAALVLIPLVFWKRPVEREPARFRVIVADMSRGDDAPEADKPGDGPIEEPEPIPEAPPAGPEEAAEEPPENPEPAPAPPADAPPAPSPEAMSKLLEQMRPRPAVSGDSGTPAQQPASGGVPLGKPGSLGGLRSAAGRRAAVSQAGGSGASEGAVEAGLRWLAKHQAADGRWSGHDFNRQCEAGHLCRGPGYITYDPGLTGLALTAFAGAGYGHIEGPHQRTVRRGLAWILSRQDAQGYFFQRVQLRDMYNHACATLAVAELYGLSGDQKLKRPLERAVQALLMAQQPGGGWTYVPLPPKGPRNDVSIAGFATQALVAARAAGIQVPQTALSRILGMVRRQTAPETGWVRYADGGSNDLREGVGILSVGILCRLLLGDGPHAPGLALGQHHLAIARPELEAVPRPRSLNRGHYVVYYGTLAAFLSGGNAWAQWNPAASNLLVREQRTLGCARGSWDPAGKWAASGGRIYATTLALLSLEVYYKYLPSYMNGRLRTGSVQVPEQATPRRPAEPDDEAARRARTLRELLGGGK